MHGGEHLSGHLRCHPRSGLPSFSGPPVHGPVKIGLLILQQALVTLRLHSVTLPWLQD